MDGDKILEEWINYARASAAQFEQFCDVIEAVLENNEFLTEEDAEKFINLIHADFEFRQHFDESKLDILREALTGKNALDQLKKLNLEKPTDTKALTSISKKDLPSYSKSLEDHLHSPTEIALGSLEPPRIDRSVINQSNPPWHESWTVIMGIVLVVAVFIIPIFVLESQKFQTEVTATAVARATTTAEIHAAISTATAEGRVAMATATSESRAFSSTATAEAQAAANTRATITAETRATGTVIAEKTANIQLTTTAEMQAAATIESRATAVALRTSTAEIRSTLIAIARTTEEAQKTATAIHKTATAEARATATIQAQETADAWKTVTAEMRATTTTEAKEIAQAQQTVTAVARATATAEARPTPTPIPTPTPPAFWQQVLESVVRGLCPWC